MGQIFTSLCISNPVNKVGYFGLATEKNENQSKEFTNYFYGEYEPHCHCEAHRTCKRGGDIGRALSNFGHGATDFLLNNVRFQGSLQALGGLVEAKYGAEMTLTTYGAAAPLGVPIMAHGLDQFIAGASTTITGTATDTVTSQLLQKAGVPPHIAHLVNNSLSTLGSIKSFYVLQRNSARTSIANSVSLSLREWPLSQKGP